MKLGGLKWYFIKKKIDTKVLLDKNFNLDALDIHPRPQPAQLASSPSKNML